MRDENIVKEKKKIINVCSITLSKTKGNDINKKIRLLVIIQTYKKTFIKK